MTLDNKRGNLMNILKKREEKRINEWDDEKNKKYKIFLDNLLESHNNLVNAIKNEIINKTKILKEQEPYCIGFNMINPEEMDCDIKNFKPSSIMKGFWNKTTRRWTRIQHIEAGIKNKPIDEISRDLNKLGYIVQDISDNNKSNKTYIRVLINKVKL